MRLIVLILLLAGCSLPSVNTWGGSRERVEANDFVFDVNFNHQEAEAYRVNKAWRPARGVVFEAAAVAIEQASGCAVPRSSLDGDITRITAEVRC